MASCQRISINFIPTLYGPFAQEVYADIERLSDGPMIETFPGEDGRPFYRLVSSKAAGLFSLSDDLKLVIGRVVEWVRSMPFDELVRAIYYLYPDQRENSVFQGYSDEQAQAESFQRGFAEIAAGGGRSALDLADELLRRR